jgi:hypothetical protein
VVEGNAGYSITCRNTKLRLADSAGEAKEFPVVAVVVLALLPAPDTSPRPTLPWSTDAMRGMISVRGASGNLGTEGTFKDGTARTVPVRPGALVFFSPTGTATGAGGTYPTRNGVKNVCATAPDPDSTPTTGVVTTEHSVSEARSALIQIKESVSLEYGFVQLPVLVNVTERSGRRPRAVHSLRVMYL